MPAGPAHRYGLLVTCLVTLAAVPVYILVRAGTTVLDRQGALPATSPFLAPGGPVPAVSVPERPRPAPSPTGSGSGARQAHPRGHRPPGATPTGSRAGGGTSGAGPSAGYVSRWTWQPPATPSGAGDTGGWRWTAPAPMSSGVSGGGWPADGSLILVAAAEVPAVLGSR